MTHMGNYKKLSQPPKWALREIKAGRLKGKTDINPQWRYQAMTEVYGACGIGWTFEVVDLWTVTAPDNQMFAFATINLYIKEDGVWSSAIPGAGGNMLVAKEKSGLHANDEGYKMAITDAMSTAMKMLGVAADVYSGAWDGSKYAPREEKPSNLMTKEQIQKVQALAGEVEPFDSTPEQKAETVKKVAALLGVSTKSTTADQFDILWKQAEDNDFNDIYAAFEESTSEANGG